MSAASELQSLAERATAIALDAGAASAEAYVQDERDVEIRVYDRAVESLTEAGSTGIGIRAYLSGGRTGHAFGTDLTDTGLSELAAKAVEVAASADEDEHAGLPDDCGAAETGPLVAADLAEWDTARKVELAIAVDDAARTADTRVSQVEQSIYADSHGFVALANSNGFSGAYEASGAYAYSSAFAGEGADLMTGLGLGIARGPSELDAAAIGGEAAARAVQMLGARPTSSRKAPVVLDEFTASSFIGLIASALSGEAILRGRSPFVGKLEDEVASARLTISDDGLADGGPSTAPFDGEGVAQRVTPLIAGGRVMGQLFDTRTAREAGTASSGNGRRGSYRGTPGPGSTNTVVEAGDKSLEQLIADASDGLYVTNVVGLHSGVNPVSGTFSVGASGVEIENGELAGPVRELTIASDLVSMLQAVAAVGSQRRWIPFGGSVLAPPLLVSEMTIAG